MPLASRTRVARAERAQATRRRIVEAAGPLFVEHGYLATTMAGIARAADVAVQTLYLSFGSKVAVLDGALAAAGEDHPAEWLAQLRDEPDGRAALAAYVTATAAVVERKHPLATVLRAAAADPEPAELLERSRHAALANHAEAVDELAEKPGFTHQLSLQRATDIVAALLSPEAYALLVVDHGWTTPDWCDWTACHLAADLFP